MDNKFWLLGFSGSLQSLNAFQIQSKSRPKSDMFMETKNYTICPESTRGYAACDPNIRGIKRKWNDGGGAEVLDDRLWLRQSPSSSDYSSTSSAASTISSAKETDEESSMDIELNFHLNLAGSDETHNTKHDVLGTRKVVESGSLPNPKLCVPTQSSSSELTTISPVCMQKIVFLGLPFNSSIDSSQTRLDIAAAPASSSVTCISEFENLQPQRTKIPECGSWGCKEKTENASCCFRQGNAKVGATYQEDHHAGFRKKGDDCGRSLRGNLGMYPDYHCINMQMAETCSNFSKGCRRVRQCHFPGCSKYVLISTLFCKSHCGGRGWCCAAPNCTKRTKGGTSFCAHHGGGKRCQVRGCIKSAKGMVDFCRKHGGGKKCPWGHVGSVLGKGEPPCDQYARSKTGLCTAHKALVQDRRVHGGTVVPDNVEGSCTPRSEDVSFYSADPHSSFAKVGVPAETEYILNSVAHRVVPLQCANSGVTEGRVHGGSLLAMLKSGVEEEGNVQPFHH